jgi:ribonuclease P protein component
VRPLTQAADFQRVLAAPSRARSTHFVLHHLPEAPQVRRKPKALPFSPELSTLGAPAAGDPVDNQSRPSTAPAVVWLGTVVPKRHAKRAVTRGLLKRQMRSAVLRHADRLPGGLWIVRLRNGFDRQQFTSAASEALRAAVRTELETVLQRALR